VLGAPLGTVVVVPPVPVEVDVLGDILGLAEADGEGVVCAKTIPAVISADSATVAAPIANVLTILKTHLTFRFTYS
jgi:hypothetical protein